MARSVEELIIKLSADNAELRRKLKQSEGDVVGFSSNVGRSLNQLKGAILAAFSVQAISAFTRGVVDASVAFEAAQRKFKFAAGSAEAGAREFKFVRDIANEMGLSLQQAADDYGSLAAAARGSSLEGEETRRIFRAVASASAVLGLSADKAHLALLAIQQMMSKGKVTAEDYRQQFAEQVPGAMRLLEKATGSTGAELAEFLQKGQLLSDDVLPRLADELIKAFGPEVEEAAKSTQAEINRFNTAVFDLKNTIGGGGFIEELTKALRELTGVLADPAVQQSMRDLGALLGDIVSASARAAAGIADLLSGRPALAREGLKQSLASVRTEIQLTNQEMAKLVGSGPSSFSVFGTAPGTSDAQARVIEMRSKLLRLQSEERRIVGALGDESGVTAPSPFTGTDRVLPPFVPGAAKGGSGRKKAGKNPKLDFSITHFEFFEAEQKQFKAMVDGFEKDFERLEKSADKFADEGVEHFRTMERAAEAFGDVIGRTISNFVFEGKADFASLAKSFAAALIEMQVSAAASGLFRALAGTGSGKEGLIGKGFAAFIGGIAGHAEGGLVTRPHFGVVGEAGPELIVPLDKLNGFGGGVQVNVHNYGGQPVQVAQSRIAGRTSIDVMIAGSTARNRARQRDFYGDRHRPGAA
jgi:tape measure domain-containing protein